MDTIIWKISSMITQIIVGYSNKDMNIYEFMTYMRVYHQVEDWVVLGIAILFVVIACLVFMGILKWYIDKYDSKELEVS